LKLFPIIRGTPSQSPDPSPALPKSEANLRDDSPIAEFGFGDCVAARRAGGVVASTGAACRMQIRQGTGVTAVHPIVLVANLIKDKSD